MQKAKAAELILLRVYAPKQLHCVDARHCKQGQPGSRAVKDRLLAHSREKVMHQQHARARDTGSGLHMKDAVCLHDDVEKHSSDKHGHRCQVICLVLRLPQVHTSLRVQKETDEMHDEHCLHAFMVEGCWCVA